MLIPVKPGQRHTAYLFTGATALAQGKFVYAAGLATSNNIPPKFGYMRTGGKIVKPATAASAGGVLGSGVPVYPVRTLTLKDSGGDAQFDTIPSGKICVYFEGGEYMTDEYASGVIDSLTASSSANAYGTKLYINSASQLCITKPTGPSFIKASGEAPTEIPPKHTAIAVKVTDTPSGAKYFPGEGSTAKRLLWFRLV